MQVVQERVYKAIADLMRMPGELNALERAYRDEGYHVERGFAGTVILKLEDGEVHFVPGGTLIRQIVFRN